MSHLVYKKHNLKQILMYFKILESWAQHWSAVLSEMEQPQEQHLRRVRATPRQPKLRRRDACVGRSEDVEMSQNYSLCRKWVSCDTSVTFLNIDVYRCKTKANNINCAIVLCPKNMLVTLKVVKSDPKIILTSLYRWSVNKLDTYCVAYLDKPSEILFWPLFNQAVFFWGSWGSIENWFELKTKPPSGNLACPNPWNAL